MQRRQTGEKISLSAEVLCNYIMPFFNWNIQKINQSIVLYSSTISSELTSPTYSFPSFKLPNSSDISDLIRNSKPSTCNLDPHLVLFRSCLLSLVPLISVKTAAINGILKKTGADPSNFLSNQLFISKILFAIQLHSLLSHNMLCEQFQSGFCFVHNSVTALTKITNYMAADFSLLTILILLDFSAAFDTISHITLLKRLSSIGITHTLRDWFKSYLFGS